VPASPIESAISTLLEQLTLSEKLAMLDGDTELWAGMVDTVRHDAYHRHPWPAGVVDRLGITGLHFVDGPRGVVLEGGATTFPAAIARGATFDVDLEQRIGDAIGAEVRSVEANLFGGVCVNLLRHPGWGRAQETYGEDPAHVAAMGAAAVRGVREHTIACVKHFALNSIDSARFRVDVRVSDRVLHEVYLPQFRAAVEAGAMAVMSAYNSVNGAWCGQNPTLLTEVLKGRWGFTGFVLTDFIFGLRDSAAAVNAGLDLEMPFAFMLHADLGEAVASGTVPTSRIDDAVSRMLRAQMSIPTDEDGSAYPASLRGNADHRALAREAATKSIVLLANDPVEGTAVLPLPEHASLAVIGTLADEPNLGDHGSSDTRPAAVVTPLGGITHAAAGPITYATGADQDNAAALAADADAAVVVVGLTWRDEGENIDVGDIAWAVRRVPPPPVLARSLPDGVLGRLWPSIARGLAAASQRAPAGGAAGTTEGFVSGDRTNLRLSPTDEALIRRVAAANPRTVVVLMGGGAIVTESWRHHVPAMLLLWYPGQEGGHALADVLFGRVAPSGRMPFTVPTDHGHLPPFDPRATSITYDLWHGYRRLSRDGHRAAFAFGHGLSYSDITEHDLRARAHRGGVTCTAEVSNDGGTDTDHVVCVYVEPPGAAVQRPVRMLAGFVRVHVRAGERVTARVRVPWRTLAYVDEDTTEFVIEGGPHRFVTAPDALALEATAATVTLSGRVLGP
jgi:beta-glucosidase